jgi:sugar phosphate isomerase/epimerase
MDLGLLISVTGLRVGIFEDGAKLASAVGFSHVELGGCRTDRDRTAADLGPFSNFEAEDVAAGIRERQLQISAIQAHVDYLSADRSVTQARVRHTRRIIDIAQVIRVGFVHTVSGPLPEGMTEDDAFALLAEVYGNLTPYAESKGIKLGIEPVFAYVVGTAQTTERLLTKLRDDTLYINFDPSHFPFHHESPEAFIRTFADRIAHCHAKDAKVGPVNEADLDTFRAWDMGDGNQFAFAPPGEGILDWPAILAALDNIGYDGVLSLELGYGTEDEDAVTRRSFRFLKGLLSERAEAKKERAGRRTPPPGMRIS